MWFLNSYWDIIILNSAAESGAQTTVLLKKKKAVQMCAVFNHYARTYYIDSIHCTVPPSLGAWTSTSVKTGPIDAIRTPCAWTKWEPIAVSVSRALRETVITAVPLPWLPILVNNKYVTFFYSLQNIKVPIFNTHTPEKVHVYIGTSTH